jgi:uncharacterized protein (TIGR02996 family)
VINGRSRGRLTETIEQAFLDALIESPEDDTPRLVFADWLDDHGKSERAELIRVQCRLARMRDGDPERPRLLARERELLRTHTRAWLRELPRARGFRYGPFVRGFVEEVEVGDGEAFCKKAAAVLASAPIRRFTRRHVTYTSQDPTITLAACPHLARFSEIDLSGTSFEDRGILSLLSSPHLKRLRVLNLTQTRMTPATLLAVIQQPACRQLEDLNLDNNDLGVEGAERLVGWPAPALRHLSLCFCNLDNVSGLAVLRSSHLPALTCLELWGNRIDPGFVRSLLDGPDRPGLTHLGLGTNHLGSRGASLIAEWRGLARFPYLDLAHNNIHDPDGRLLLASPGLPGLKELHLYWHREFDDRSGKLTWPGFLSLYNNGIGRAGIRALAGSPYLRLEGLKIWDNQLTRRGIEVWEERFPDAVLPRSE